MGFAQFLILADKGEGGVWKLLVLVDITCEQPLLDQEKI